MYTEYSLVKIVWKGHKAHFMTQFISNFDVFPIYVFPIHLD